jgi:hypothetical protein
MKTLLITLACILIVSNISYSQSNASLFTGIGATNSRGSIRPLAGLRYWSLVNKHAVLGVEVSYEPTRFIKGDSFYYSSTTYDYSSHLLYISPILGYAIDKKALLQVHFYPSLGLFLSGSGTANERWTRFYPGTAIPEDTVYIDRTSPISKSGFKNFVMRLGIGVQKSFVLSSNFHVFVGGSFHAATQPYGERGDPKPLMYALRTGLNYQFAKRGKKTEEKTEE